MYEPFYLLHERFDPAAKNWIGWKVNPVLVRSIEDWCSQIEPLAPLEPVAITDRVKIQAHFDRWCADVRASHGLERSSIVDLFAQHLLERLRQFPTDATTQLHWLALFSQRCATVGWQVWRLMPQPVRSIELFEEIVSYAYSKIAALAEVHSVLANFQPGTSQFVSGLNHLKAFLDRRIRYSIFPYLRETSGDPNFGRTNLGVAARYSRGEVLKALRYVCATERGDDDIILWQCFDLYRRETGIAVNRLVTDDFGEIGDIYRQRRHQSSPCRKDCDREFDAVAIEQRLAAIGGAIRRYELRQLQSLDAPISGCDDNNPVGISWGETKLCQDRDLLQSLAAQDILQIVWVEVANLFSELVSNLTPSYHQLFWLYYGLELTQQQIGEIIHLNFGLTNNAGSVALRLRRGRNRLFQRIHTALKNDPPQLTVQEIDAAMGAVLEMYFERAMPRYFTTISISADRSTAELRSILLNLLERDLILNLPLDLIQTSLDRLSDRFGNAT